MTKFLEFRNYFREVIRPYVGSSTDLSEMFGGAAFPASFLPGATAPAVGVGVGANSESAPTNGVASSALLPSRAQDGVSAGVPRLPMVPDPAKHAQLFPTAAGLPGSGGRSPGTVDMTVLAYAQWLSEMKQQSTNARYQQQAELDLIREAISANTNDLGEFKRQSTQVVQQLQAQVVELRASLRDVTQDLAQQIQRRADGINSLRDAQSQMDGGRQPIADQVERLQAEIVQLASSTRALEGDLGDVRRALGSSQEQTVIKFGEVDQAMSLCHSAVAGAKQEFTDTKGDWKRGQDLLGQAISTLSQDFADFQKHSSTVLNKLQSDVYHLESVGRDEKDRLNRAEAQISGIAQGVYHTANEMILMKSETKRNEAQPQPQAQPQTEYMLDSAAPQRQFATPALVRATSDGVGSGSVGSSAACRGSGCPTAIAPPACQPVHSMPLVPRQMSQERQPQQPSLPPPQQTVGSRVASPVVVGVGVETLRAPSPQTSVFPRIPQGGFGQPFGSPAVLPAAPASPMTNTLFPGR